MSPDGCLTPSSGFYCSEQPSILSTSSRGRYSTWLKINFVSVLHQSLAAASSSVGHTACSLVLGNIKSFASSRRSMGCWSSRAFWHCKSHHQAGMNSAVLLRAGWATNPARCQCCGQQGWHSGSQLVKGHQLPCHRICASQWPVTRMEVAHTKHGHTFLQHFFGWDSCCKSNQRKMPVLLTKKQRAWDGSDLSHTATTPAALKHLVPWELLQEEQST